MSQHDVEVMRRAYDAFNRGDSSETLAVFDEQIEWHEPGGGNAPQGVYHGLASVTDECFAAVPANFEEFRAEPERFIGDAAGYVVVIGTYRGCTKGGQRLEAPFAHVWAMRDGKAAQFRNHVEADPWRQAWGG
jgi:ketosteroid isomerase-like protein